MQDETYRPVAEALRRGEPVRNLDERHRLLLAFVETITLHAYRVTDEQVEGLREVGWSDGQIAECVYVAALFNLFVRLADAFGIEPPAAYEPDGVPPVVRQA